jgi:hypothetical protein
MIMKYVVTFICSLLAAVSVFSQDCASQMNTGVTASGYHPNPAPFMYYNISYDEVITVVIPSHVPKPGAPGEFLGLCGIRIKSIVLDSAQSTGGVVVPGFNYSWELWQGGTQKNINDEVFVDSTAINRVCVRLKHANPPLPNTPLDYIFIRVVAEGKVDLDGPGGNPCFWPGTSAHDTSYLVVPLGAGVGLEGIPDQAMTTRSYPNPANDQTTIQFTAPASGAARLTVTDMVGRIVAVQENIVSAGPSQFQLNVTELAPAFYGYSIEFNGQAVNGKICIRR